MNFQSQPLQRHELDTLKSDPSVIERLLRSYRLMLDFYGMKLVNAETGLLERSSNYSARYRNLVRAC